VPVKFNLILTQRISEDKVKDWFLNVDDGYEALWQRAVATASEVVSGTELDSILHDREKLYGKMVASLQSRVATWGITIIAIEIKDISIVDEAIQEAIAMKARASKEAEAELVRAEKQKQIAVALKEAADIYDDKSRWLKGIETLTELCRSAENNTIMVPTDLLSTLAMSVKAVSR
jgi:regulator of protease activity HflC (stomatin/prohibitin superfamily)